MPVTIKVSPHGSTSWHSSRFTQVQSPQRLLHATTSDENGGQSSSKHSSIIQTSFKDDLKPASGAGAPPSPTTTKSSSSSASSLATPSSSNSYGRRSPSTTSTPVFASKNGFVHACIEAYNNHHSLVLRPDDVWLAILTQLSIYVNAHADELCDRFVTHAAGREQLHIETELRDADHGALAVEMSRLLGGAIRDPGWREWIIPRFTTTESKDETVAAVVMMGTFQKYFSYSWGTRCGIPSVTLLGELSDWTRLRDRVVTSRTADGGGNRLASLGNECAAWARLLRPVLDGFVDSFRQAPSSRSFWQAICDEHVPNGSGVATYGGWITAFCFWDEKGVCLHDLGRLNDGSSSGGGGGSYSTTGSSSSSSRPTNQSRPLIRGTARLTRSQIPSGFVKCPIVLLDQGIELPPAGLVAGSVALRVRRSVLRTDADDREECRVETSSASAADRRKGGESASSSRFFGLDEVQPESGWFLYWL